VEIGFSCRVLLCAHSREATLSPDNRFCRSQPLRSVALLNGFGKVLLHNVEPGSHGLSTWIVGLKIFSFIQMGFCLMRLAARQEQLSQVEVRGNDFWIPLQNIIKALVRILPAAELQNDFRDVVTRFSRVGVPLKGFVKLYVGLGKLLLVEVTLAALKILLRFDRI